MDAEAGYRNLMHQYALDQAVKKSSLVMTRKKYEAIVKHLLHPEIKIEPSFKHWIKRKKFILAYVSNKTDPILTIPNHESRTREGQKTRLQVVHAEQIFDIVYDIHTKQLNHAGYKRVLEYVQRYYYGITRNFLQEFTKFCPWCIETRPTRLISAKQYHNDKEDVMTIVKVISKHEYSEDEAITHHIDGTETKPFQKANNLMEVGDAPSESSATLLHKMPQSFSHLNAGVEGKFVNTNTYLDDYQTYHDDSDDVDVAFVNYLVKELKSIKSPSVKKKIKKRIIDTILDCQVEEEL